MPVLPLTLSAPVRVVVPATSRVPSVAMFVPIVVAPAIVATTRIVMTELKIICSLDWSFDFKIA